MTAQATVPTTTNIEERALIDVLTGLRDQGPATAFELAALIVTMETLPRVEVGRVDAGRIATVAIVAERLAAGLDRPDLEMRARLVRADALHREGDTAESVRLVQQVRAWAAENGDQYLLARSDYRRRCSLGRSSSR